MPDNTEEEQIDTPSNSQSENSSDDTTTDAEGIIPNQKTENMEVHHHAHHEGRKNWKSYFWEFLMLFLAVFCGFLAEWQLEHVIEHSREKEFIKSMIEDAQIDTANINMVSDANKEKLLVVDSLAAIWYNDNNGKSEDYTIYKLFRKIISANEVFKPTERTLLQLKNAGGMRLIRNEASANAIIVYDGLEKDVQNQYEDVSKIIDEFMTASYELFNFKYFNPGSYRGVSHDAILLNHDKVKLIQFANKIFAYGGTLSQYDIQLKSMKEEAVKLINTLRKEYHLTDK